MWHKGRMFADWWGWDLDWGRWGSGRRRVAWSGVEGVGGMEGKAGRQGAGLGTRVRHATKGSDPGVLTTCGSWWIPEFLLLWMGDVNVMGGGWR